MVKDPADVKLCLVVDDSRVVRKVARRILEAHGFTVEEAADGAAALAACRRRMPGSVLLVLTWVGAYLRNPATFRTT